MLVGGYPITGSSWASGIRHGQALGEFMPEVAYPFIDEEDVAAIIAAVLTGGGHDDKVLDVAGTLSSAAERARLISTATGTSVRLHELTSPGEARRAWVNDGWPDVTIDVTVYAMNVFAAGARTIVPVIDQQIGLAETLLGRRPHSFADWLSSNLTAFTRSPGDAPR